MSRIARLSSADAAWLHMETPTNLMMITGLLFLDSEPDFEWLVQVLEHRLCHYERFRLKVVEKGVLSHPHWEAMRGFDVRSHLVYERLDQPAEECFLDRVSELMSESLDRASPLWEFRVFPGVNGGCALVVRLHHAIADGMALMRVLLSLCDCSRDAPRPVAQDRPEHTETRRSVFAVAKRLASSLLHEGHDLLLHPSQAVELAHWSVQAGKSLAHVLALGPDAPNMYQGELTSKKVVALSPPICLDSVKGLGKRLGCTINDVLLGVLAGALGRAIRRREELPCHSILRVVVPIDLRGGNVSELGNKFGLVFLSLPVGEPDPRKRLQKVHQAMAELKGSAEAVVTFELLSAVGVLPSEVEKTIIEWFGGKATAVVTNLPGPRRPLFLAGSKIESVMYWVPQSGRLALGISLMSYSGQIRLGVTTDFAIEPCPRSIVDDYLDALAEIKALEAV